MVTLQRLRKLLILDSITELDWNAVVVEKWGLEGARLKCQWSSKQGALS